MLAMPELRAEVIGEAHQCGPHPSPLRGRRLRAGENAASLEADRYSRRHQKETRAPKRHWRDWFGPVVPVMNPKVELLMSLDGLAKFA